ncbi:hypothetical protein NCAS_0G03880 [Naumovozyma castellii]|uniref:SANT domain-containing protein n=1 Tax=Naumovozyma castellii TaxID=27288 RepID=G0VHG9_NAUCA|nr:hypothetical protein NCAS_0G03880 [Naumovozyma castellii CBS 4309]CCC71275.1 hypothetical protein NCAS_0G03880 [Naumovozyma castellii CBS 4309]
MSSIINKSGTRFTPKIRQRRTVTTTPTATPSPRVLPIEKEHEEAEGEEEEEEEERDRHKDGDSVDNENVADDLNGPTQVAATQEISPLQSSTQTNAPPGSPKSTSRLSVSQSTKKFRSGRLASLSKAGNASIFKSSFNEDAKASTAGVIQVGRRLSTIATSSSVLKKIKLNATIAENDATLQALKRRRMSSRTSISKKSGSVHRISILSKTQVSNGETLSSKPSSKSPTPTVNGVATATAIKKDSSDDLFQKTDDLYANYTIKNVKEIPRNIQDEDSERYLIDEEQFTIAELCKANLPIGKTSDNFVRAKLATKAKLDKRKQKREMRKRAREEFRSLNSLTKEEEDEEKENRKLAAEKLLNTDVPDSYRPHAAIQLKLSADGTLAVDEDSTVVDRHKNASLENAHKQKVDENPFENLYNSHTYGRNRYTDPWTIEELIKFYKSLSMWGTDFNLIAQLFPYRTRRQVKSKFISEEKKHPVMIELALRSKLPQNFDQYCTDIRKDIGTVNDFNEKMEELQKEHEENLKAIERAKETAKLEDQTQSQSQVNADGDGRVKRRGVVHNNKKKEVVLGTIDDFKKMQKRESGDEDESSDDEEEEEEEEDEEDAEKDEKPEK